MRAYLTISAITKRGANSCKINNYNEKKNTVYIKNRNELFAATQRQS